MKLISYTFFTVTAFFLVTALRGQSRQPLIQKTPGWVTLNDYTNFELPPEQEVEDGYADIAFEQQLSVAGKTAYIRKVFKIINESGIQNASEVSVGFNPSYQSLFFHSIRVIRDNKIIDQLDLSKIKTIQQEENLNRFLYNGSLRSILFLEDVRKGDVIDYSFSLVGSNPVFDGKFAARFATEFSYPFGNLYYKVVTPLQKQLAIKNNNTQVTPLITKAGQERVYEWRLTNVKALRMDDNVPLWFNPFGEVMVSEYKNWAEVSEVALSLFPVVKNISEGLRQQINDIQKAAHTQEQKVLAVLRFVQDNIRYMGIEMGQSSHKPHHPNQVFAQRFGDCKDKTYLMCTMLSLMNIKADPVLINTSYKHAITKMLPMPAIFDHVTVRVTLNGKQYFFDPTISFQRGPIDAIAYPQYAYGLLVAEGTTGLTKIDTKEPGQVVVKEVFDLKDMDGDARLKVTTAYSGGFADGVREGFHTNSRYEMQRSYHKFYNRYFEDIVSDSLTFFDNDSSGVFTTVEHYSIKNMWGKDEAKSAFFSPFVINSVIQYPKNIKRSMPYSLHFPAKYQESVIINLPSEWDAEENTEKISAPYFLLSARHFFRQKSFVLEYRYESLRDHVMPAEMEDFSKHLQKKEDRFPYSLHIPR